MDKYAIAEVAYKNGYEAGVKEFAEKLKEKADGGFWQEHCYVDVEDIDNLAKELTKNDAERK